MSKNVAMVIGLVVVTLCALAFVIFRGMNSSDDVKNGLVPPPRAGGPTFEPMPVTSKSMPTTDTSVRKPTSKLRNISPTGDTAQ